MPILSGSRYDGVQYTGIRTRDGAEKKYLHNRKVFNTDAVKRGALEHVLIGGEDLDSVAQRFYKRDDLYWLIGDVNDILFPLDIPPGTVLLVPNPDVLTELGFDL